MTPLTNTPTKGDPIRIAVAGALGRMGRAVSAMVEDDTDLVLAARFDRADISDPILVPQAQALAAALPLAKTCVAALEDILAGKPYFAGDAVSLADLFAYGHFEFLGQTPEGADMLAGSPLLGWIERMAVRPSVQATTWDRLAESVAA